jgi:UDP-glucose 4-epimerase
VKIVITGALGHIGSRLVRELSSVHAIDEMVLLDNLSTQRYCSLFNLPATGQYRFLEADILTADLARIFQGATAVVHLAAITDATTSFQNTEEVHRVNLLGTERVAEACQQVDCPLIFPSTTSVYGSQSNEVDEDCPVSELNPQSPYAESKLKSEQLLGSMKKERGLRFITCRFGTIFGPSIGMRFHTAINKFCWQAVMGHPLTVWKTALNQHRPYLDLGDAVEAIKFIIQKKLYDGRVYNVVTTNVSISNIVDIITKYLPDTSIEKVSTPIMNQLSYHVSNYRFRDQGFEFKGNLIQGIGETIDLLKVAHQRSSA